VSVRILNSVKYAACVWVGHFPPEDWVLKIGNDRKICFDMIQKSDITRRKFAQNSSFDKMPPLPLASKCDITDVALNFFSLRYNDNHTLDNFMKTYRKNKLLPLAKYFELDHPAKEMAASMSHSTYHYKRLPGGRLGEKKPFHESYIGTADQLILLAKEMEEHAKKCAGEIVILRQGVKNSGLTLCVKGKCSLGLQCECIGEGKSRFIHAGGVFYWQSAASITIASATTSKQVSTPDVLLAVASQTTRGGLSGVEQVLSTMGLTHRNRNYTTFVLHHHGCVALDAKAKIGGSCCKIRRA